MQITAYTAHIKSFSRPKTLRLNKKKKQNKQIFNKAKEINVYVISLQNYIVLLLNSKNVLPNSTPKLQISQ